MTPTGHKDRAQAVVENIKARRQHTREVRETLPDDIRLLVIETAGTVTQQAIEIAELKADVAKLHTVLREYLKGAA